MVTFPRNGVGTGQCLGLLPEPGSQLRGFGFQQLPGSRSHSRFNPPVLGGVGGGSSPDSLLELTQEHCLALSEGKQKQAVTQRQIFSV